MGPLYAASLCLLLATQFIDGPTPTPRLPVLFETEHIAVVSKPPSVPCHRHEVEVKGRRRRLIDAPDGDPVPVLQRAQSTFPGRRIHLVHRLDAATSGCLLLAFSSDAAREASTALAERGRKTYYALCRGDGASLRTRGSFVADGDVKDSKGIKRTASTEIEGLFGSNGPPRRCCLVRAMPQTGRWHQVRQHLGRENHPILGETRHHKDTKENRAWREILGDVGIAQRVCLHCHRLQIDGDMGGMLEGGLDVRCPLPPDMQSIIDLTDWASEERQSLPELFEQHPNGTAI